MLKHQKPDEHSEAGLMAGRVPKAAWLIRWRSLADWKLGA